jgi:hypothetical protein
MCGLLLVLFVAAGLAGCGDKSVLPSNTNEKTETSPQGTVKSPTIKTPPPDKMAPPGR